jgi:hypothetical protein
MRLIDSILPCLLLADGLLFYLEIGGSTLDRNISKLLADYTVSQFKNCTLHSDHRENFNPNIIPYYLLF